MYRAGKGKEWASESRVRVWEIGPGGQGLVGNCMNVWIVDEVGIATPGGV